MVAHSSYYIQAAASHTKMLTLQTIVICFYIYVLFSGSFAALCQFFKSLDKEDYVSAIICLPLTYYSFTLAVDLYKYELRF